MIIDANTIQQILLQVTWLVPVVIALVAVLRVTFNIADRFVPGTSVLCGIAAGLLFVGLSVVGGAVGLLIGLSASGLYDFGKKTVLDA